MTRRTLAIAALASLLTPATGWPCSGGYLGTPATLVDGADVIVRAVAIGGPEGRPAPQGTVQFLVQERLKGEAGPELRLTGLLTAGDDFNDRDVPYDFVRRGGRHGDCFATGYKNGGTFLLFLKRDRKGQLSTQWAALKPVNEQLRGDDDPWLLWVRDRVSRGAPRTGPSPAPVPR
jgi:hypothetical protein